MEPIPFGKPVFTQEELDEVAKIMVSGWVGTGPRVQEFEKQFAAYLGSRRALGVASGTAALHVALKSLGVGPGDEVITTAMTFAATVNAIIMTGATPVLVDCDRRHHNIDLEAVDQAVTGKTKAIVPVHFAGAPVDLDALARLKHKHGVRIVHDCAHAIETEWNGKKVGSADDISCFSFYATKNMTTIEGGMICTNNDMLADKIHIIRNHGMSKDAWRRFRDSKFHHYDIECLGYKSNLTDLQAGLGLLQLKHLDERHKIREQIWRQYQTAFASLPLERPLDVAPNHRHAYHLYTLQTPPGMRDEWLQSLQQAQIGCGVHYRAIPEFTYYKHEYGWKREDFPNAVAFGNRTLSIPLSPYLKPDEVQSVISAITKLCVKAA